MDATSSPMPSVIMAKGVPDFRVLTKPSSMANSMPATPPTSGTSTKGTGSWPLPARFMACMAMNEPSPV